MGPYKTNKQWYYFEIKRRNARDHTFCKTLRAGRMLGAPADLPPISSLHGRVSASMRYVYELHNNATQSLWLETISDRLSFRKLNLFLVSATSGIVHVDRSDKRQELRSGSAVRRICYGSVLLLWGGLTKTNRALCTIVTGMAGK